MTHKVYSYSSLARPLDPKFRTNLAVIILAPLGGIAVAIYLYLTNIMGIGDTVLLAIEAMFVAFLAWALGRELDPDINQSAFVAMALALVAVALGYNTSILNIAAVLFAVRIVNRTVGNPLKLIDLIMMGLFAAGLAVLGAPWWTCFLIAAALTIDTVFDQTQGNNLMAAGVAFIAGLYAMAMNGAPHPENAVLIERGWLVAATVVGGLFLLMIFTTPEPQSCCDVRLDEKLQKRRIQAGMALALVGAIACLFGGPPQMFATLPVWAALAGVVEGRAMPKRPRQNNP